MGKKDLEFKGILSTDQLVACLEQLTEGLRTGVLCLRTGEEIIVLRPTGWAKIEIEASEKKDKSKLSLELSWKPDLEVKENKISLFISPMAPVAPGETATGTCGCSETPAAANQETVNGQETTAIPEDGKAVEEGGPGL